MSLPLPKTNNSRTWDAFDKIFDEAFSRGKNKINPSVRSPDATTYRTPDGFRSPSNTFLSSPDTMFRTPDTIFRSPDATATYRSPETIRAMRAQPRFSNPGATPYASWYYGNESNESLGLSGDDLNLDPYRFHGEDVDDFHDEATHNNTRGNSYGNLNSPRQNGDPFDEIWDEGLRKTRRSTITKTTTKPWRSGLDNAESSGSGTASTSSGSIMGLGLGFGSGASPPGTTGAPRNSLGTSPPVRSGMGTSPPVRSGMPASPPVRSSILNSPPARPSMPASPPVKSKMPVPAPTPPQVPTDGPAIEVNSPGPGERDRVTSPEPGPGGKVKRKKSKATFHDLPDGRTVKATFDLQGVKKADVHVSYQNDKVVLSWEKIETEERQEEGKVVRERRERRWVRTLPLPDGTKFEDIKASMDGRHLVLTYPKYNVRSARPVLSIEIKKD